MRSLADRLIALNDLRVRGYLTEVEFALAKARILAAEEPAHDPGSGPVPPPPPVAPKTLNPVVPAVGLGLGAAGGFGG